MLLVLIWTGTMFSWAEEEDAEAELGLKKYKVVVVGSELYERLGVTSR
jgi:hypothetical protein